MKVYAIRTVFFFYCSLICFCVVAMEKSNSEDYTLDQRVRFLENERYTRLSHERIQLLNKYVRLKRDIEEVEFQLQETDKNIRKAYSIMKRAKL